MQQSLIKSQPDDKSAVLLKGAADLQFIRDLVVLMLLLVVVAVPEQAYPSMISALSHNAKSILSAGPDSATTTNGAQTNHSTQQLNITSQTTSTVVTPAQLANRTSWQEHMSHTATPSTGCFQAVYPNLVWQQTTCGSPISGHETPSNAPATMSTVGNGNDFVAESSSTLIASAVGSFSSVTGLTGETDVCVAPFLAYCTHAPLADYYSLQMNAIEGFPVTFNGWVGTGWQQFVYDNDPTGAFRGVWIEYWLFNYLTAHTSCPSSVSQNPPDGSGWFQSGSHCVWNTAVTPTPNEPPTRLSLLSLQVFANLNGQDEAQLCVAGGACYTKSEPAAVLNLYQQWRLAEFNIVGYIDGSQAQFNSGTSITVVNTLTDQSGNAIAPVTPCPNAGQTGETNNLNLGSCLPINIGQIGFTESNLASWVTVSVYSDDLQFKGQNPVGLTDLHGDISNSYQNAAGLTTYLFSVPTNTQVTFTIAQAPSGWYFVNDWDDYGFVQYLGFSSLTINVGTRNHEVAAFFTYIAIFQQSGIPFGTTWGVTVGGYRYTTSSSAIELIGLDGVVSYSYDTTVTGTSGAEYVCTSGCSGSMSGPMTVTVNYQKQYYFTTSSAYDSPNPASGWYNAGSLITASVSSLVSGGTGTQYVCTGWTGSGSVPSSGSTCSTNFNMNAPSSITWNWKTQYQLTITLNGHGTTTPLSGAWYDSGRSIIVTIGSDGTNSSNTRYLISTITGSGGGSYSGSSDPFTVTMNAPITESVAWMTQYTLTVNLNGHGTSGPSSGNWHNSAASVQVTIGGDVSSNSSNTRYVYNGATGSGFGSFTGSANPFTVTMNAPITESIVWQTQYMLTTIANPPTAGVVTPTSGWQNAGATVTIQATPNPDYSFVGWIGSGSGSFSGLGSPSITMNGPITETANFLMSTSISTSVSTSSISIASSVGLSGSITPNPSSVQVTLSLSIDSGSTWVTFMTVMTDGSGGYSTGWAPPYPGSFLLKASWSGNGQFAGSTSSPVSLTVIGSVTPTPTLLLFAPSTVSRSQLVTLSITVFNPTSSPLNANVTVQITGPSNYVSFDVIQIQVGASSQLTTYFDWTVPNQSGAYSVTVGLLQARPGGIDTGTIQPVTGTIQVT